MWQAIASNQRRSQLLISLMAFLLVGLGGIIGLAADPQLGGPIGALIALAIYFLLLLSAMVGGSEILLSAAGARQIVKEDAPRLWNVIEEMTIAAGLPAMPSVYIIDDDSPNAFAVGRRPEKAAVAVTSGLLRRLTRDELQGVIAHEIGHIRNEDTRFLTLAAVMVGAISMLAEIFLRSLRYCSWGERRSSRDSGSGGVQIVIFLIAIIAAILAPLFAQLLYFACSRRREFLADASSARFTRYPEGLASALEKISAGSAGCAEVSRTVAPMYIVNPLQDAGKFSLYSTHPPTDERVRILRSMGGLAGLSDYENAYRKVYGGKDAIGQLSLETDSVAARPANPEPAPREDAIARAREVQGVLGRLGQFLTLPCACGVNIKVPTDFQGNEVICPRCGNHNAVPRAQSLPQSSGAAEAPRGANAPPMLYERKTPGAWESFACECGQAIQLSPVLMATHIKCPRCKRRIDIEQTVKSGHE